MSFTEGTGRIPWKRIVGLALALLVLSLGSWLIVGKPKAPVDAHASLRVMTHSSFMNAWGPGPDIAKRFRDETGITVEFHDAGDAGLILQKLELFPVDVVIGLDGLSLADAKSRHEWKALKSAPNDPGAQFREQYFAAYDYAPLAFNYREGEIKPPTSLDDLLDPRFKGQIALQDPRTSTPGLQFLLWVLDVKGIEEGFKFLAALKENLHSVSPSWSSSYGAFKKKQAGLVFSYATSPIYHLVEEKDSSYRAAIFETGHPLQVEYMGIPDACTRCEDAEKFVRFLLKPEIQTVIMSKNYMLPVEASVLPNTPFAQTPTFRIHDLKSAPELIKQRSVIFERWRALGL